MRCVIFIFSLLIFTNANAGFWSPPAKISRIEYEEASLAFKCQIKYHLNGASIVKVTKPLKGNTQRNDLLKVDIPGATSTSLAAFIRKGMTGTCLLKKLENDRLQLSQFAKFNAKIEDYYFFDRISDFFDFTSAGNNFVYEK